MSKYVNLSIGERVREQRVLSGYTREAFAEIIDISPQFLAEIERGVKGMSVATLKKVCVALGVSSDYILFGRNKGEADRSKLDEIINNLDPVYYSIAEGMLRLLVRSTIISDKILSDEESNDSE